MSKLTRMLAALMLALYGMASMHCALEAVPGFDFLKICCFVDSQPGSSHDTPDCEGDGCAVEKAKYRLEEQEGRVPPPQWLTTVAVLLCEHPLSGLEINSSWEGDPPPELGPAWQFYLRAALPPRAPTPAV